MRGTVTKHRYIQRQGRAMPCSRRSEQWHKQKVYPMLSHRVKFKAAPWLAKVSRKSNTWVVSGRRSSFSLGQERRNYTPQKPQQTQKHENERERDTWWPWVLERSWRLGSMRAARSRHCAPSSHPSSVSKRRRGTRHGEPPSSWARAWASSPELWNFKWFFFFFNWDTANIYHYNSFRFTI